MKAKFTNMDLKSKNSVKNSVINQLDTDKINRKNVDIRDKNNFKKNDEDKNKNEENNKDKSTKDNTDKNTKDNNINKKKENDNGPLLPCLMVNIVATIKYEGTTSKHSADIFFLIIFNYKDIKWESVKKADQLNKFCSFYFKDRINPKKSKIGSKINDLPQNNEPHSFINIKNNSNELPVEKKYYTFNSIKKTDAFTQNKKPTISPNTKKTNELSKSKESFILPNINKTSSLLENKKMPILSNMNKEFAVIYSSTKKKGYSCIRYIQNHIENIGPLKFRFNPKTISLKDIENFINPPKKIKEEMKKIFNKDFAEKWLELPNYKYLNIYEKKIIELIKNFETTDDLAKLLRKTNQTLFPIVNKIKIEIIIKLLIGYGDGVGREHCLLHYLEASEKRKDVKMKALLLLNNFLRFDKNANVNDFCFVLLSDKAGEFEVKLDVLFTNDFFYSKLLVFEILYILDLRSNGYFNSNSWLENSEDRKYFSQYKICRMKKGKYSKYDPIMDIR